MSSGSRTQTVNSTSTSQPWSVQVPHLARQFGEAEKLYGRPMSFFGGQTYANLSPESETALSGIYNRGLSGNPLMGASQDALMDTVSGRYLDPGANPYVGGAVDAAVARFLPQATSRFLSGGATGGGLMGRAQGEGVASAVAPVYANLWNRERDRMFDAANLAPAYAQNDYRDLAAVAGVGAQREAQAQRGIDEAMRRHEFQQMEPWSRLGVYRDMTAGNYGGTTTGQQTMTIPQPNPWAQAFGLGLGGLGTLGQSGAFGPAGWMTSLFSDARLKTDAKRVGETDEGLPIYTYRMKWVGPALMGVMAQDVAKKKPEALGPPRAGFATVDYSRVQ